MRESRRAGPVDATLAPCIAELVAGRRPGLERNGLFSTGAHIFEAENAVIEDL
jgi:hypothetical protein